MLIILPLFGIVAGRTNIFRNVNSCSCWCVPVLGNVVPYATLRQEVKVNSDNLMYHNYIFLQGPAEYVQDVRKLLVMYGLVVASHFLVGLIVLMVLCSKTLKWIRNIETKYRTCMTVCAPIAVHNEYRMCMCVYMCTYSSTQ